MGEPTYDQGDLASYDPTGGPSNVGSGGGFGANLFLLYRAGAVELPDIASRYFDMTLPTHYSGSNVESQAGAAGNPGALKGLGNLIDDLQHALRSTCMSVRDCGTALVGIAEDYVRTDAEAVEAYNQRVRATTDVSFAAPTPHVPDPPRPGDPLPTVLPPTTPPELDDWTPPDIPDVSAPDDEEPETPSYTD